MIYQLTEKEMKKELRYFFHTCYGKTVFLLAYSIPFFFFLLAFVFLFFLELSSTEVLIFILSFLFLCFLSFILGSIYFYKEFRIYLKNKNN